VRIYEGDIRAQAPQQFTGGKQRGGSLVFEGTVTQGGGHPEATGTVAQDRLAGTGSLDDLLAAAFKQRPADWRTPQESLTALA
jgi:hypothetical protein